MHTRILLCTFLAAAAAPAQSVQPPFNAAWTAVDLGAVPGTGNYGGITFRHDDPDVLLFGSFGSTRIVEVPVLRNAQGQITGFGAFRVHATVGGVDGGLCYGPGNVLLHTWFGQNKLGMIKPGSSGDDKAIALSPLGIASSVGACALAPAGSAAAGHLKIVSFSGSTWYDAVLQPDGQGTFDLVQVSAPRQLSGGPEGILYAPATAPMLANKVLIAHWSGPGIVAYDVDANADPLPQTGQVLLTGLGANGGGAIDPVTGDLLFTGGGGHLVALRSGGSCGVQAAYGAGTPGLNGVPQLSGGGCARLGQALVLQVQNGRPGALGILGMGIWQLNLQVAGITLLSSANSTWMHFLDGAGAMSVTLPIPTDPHLGDLHLYFQAGYFDAAGPQGLAASGGLDVHIL